MRASGDGFAVSVSRSSLRFIYAVYSYWSSEFKVQEEIEVSGCRFSALATQESDDLSCFLTPIRCQGA